MNKLIFSVIPITIIFLIIILLIIPISAYLPFIINSKQISFSSTQGNLFNGKFVNLSVNGFTFSQINYQTKLGTNLISTKFEVKDDVINGYLTYFPIQKKLLIEDINVNYKQELSVYGKASFQANLKNIKLLDNLYCESGSGLANLQVSNILNFTDLHLDCSDGLLHLYIEDLSKEKKIFGYLALNAGELSMYISKQHLPRNLSSLITENYFKVPINFE